MWISMLYDVQCYTLWLLYCTLRGRTNVCRRSWRITMKGPERSRTISMCESLTYLIGTVEPGNGCDELRLKTSIWITCKLKIYFNHEIYPNPCSCCFFFLEESSLKILQPSWSVPGTVIWNKLNLSRLVYGLLFAAVGLLSRARAGAPQSSLKQSSLLAYEITGPSLYVQTAVRLIRH